MARESDAPREPQTPGRPKESAKQSIAQEPEFGKPSPLGKPAHRSNSNHLFNIPKQNRARPEHHRPHQAVAEHQQQLSNLEKNRNRIQQGAPQGSGPPVAPSGASAAPSANRRGPFDPFQPVRPSAYNDYRSGIPSGATPIKRPEQVSYATPRAPRALFTSKPSAPKQSFASKNLQAFIDLTADEPGSRTGQIAQQFGQASTFGSTDVYGYVDSAKANENIKALLEGAFEEEEEAKSKFKDKKKKSKKKDPKKAQKKEAIPPAKNDTSELDDLAAQLQGVTVNDIKEGEEESADELDNKARKLKEDTEHPDNKEKVTNEKDEEAEADVGDEEEAEEEEEDESDDEDELIVEGLKVTLLPHQVEGVRWMCDKESGRHSAKGIVPKGGILADDMGLGKTVQTISLFLKNRKPEHEHSDDDTANKKGDDEDAPPSSQLSKTTLVVAPLALIKQWEAEIADKIERSHKLSVCLYHGTNRAKTAKSLGDYDVVITTYGTLTSESSTAAADKAKKSGIFSLYWYRVVLDEAHTIKNRNAKATQAACALDARYRWCLTGTPMQNNLDELQSLIKFLRIKPYNDLAAWRDQISRPLANGRGGLAIQRLQVYLKAFMKRRTKDVLRDNENDKSEGADGKPKKSNGFKIVKREVIKVEAQFMEGEMNFYKRLEQRTENRLEEMMGGAKVDYAGALVLLLRLRQACNHPELVKSDLAVDKDVLLQSGNPGSQSSEAKKDDLDDMADLFGGLSVMTKKCDVCQAELSQAESKSGGSHCTECETDLNTNFMTKDSKHKAKKAHKHHEVTTIESPIAKARSRKNRRVVLDSDDEDEDEAEWIVPEGQRKMPNLGKAGGSEDEDAEGGGEWIGSGDSDLDSPSGKKSQPIMLSSSDDESDSDDDISYEGENGELPSTKIRYLMKLLNKESADYKFIVFSVFTSMLDKIEPFLNSANIGFARYDGGMRNDHREASLNKLRNNSGTRVLLCSLRAGALGLNLTAASRVVILEPFWNPFVEEQAIDRVHRLNQTVDVKIYRMIIKGSVEERIVALQDRKRELANMTIEGKSAAGKLTMNDMMALFGRDAESKYTPTDTQGKLDFKQPTRLLNSTGDNDPPMPPQSSARADSHNRERRQQSRKSTPEDSVYGRRW
ncbi:uncharacterized protein N7484_004197 [Penicillium longicatenatum]|uniref:uncharacterized protein n=1 Tax=Penicillium longicatenatum TaxID=1561947 RepID=UPI0025485457|nr:uncharacterized protein N7484_004197 [Penicillium longicatenatum]KAJ5650474.1 hypothetical protein N7484_004197 [Penicillium longicatenatum]